MSPCRLLATLLALLSVTAGVGVPSAVLCFADDHVAYEAASDAGHCEESPEATGALSAGPSASDRNCVDVPTAAVQAERSVPDAGPQVPAPLPAVVVALLPEPQPPSRWSVHREHAGPPPHLAPLRSFVLLT